MKNYSVIEKNGKYFITDITGALLLSIPVIDAVRLLDTAVAKTRRQAVGKNDDAKG